MGLIRGKITANGYKPSLIHRLLLPKISGNKINGLGETRFRRPGPVYHWIGRLKTPFNRINSLLILNSLFNRTSSRYVRRAQELEVKLHAPVASTRTEHSPAVWSGAIKQFALANGADVAGIVPMKQDWVFEGFTVSQKWLIMLGFRMDYGELNKLPHADGANEVLRVYAHGQETVWNLVNWLHSRGWDATGYCGPMASPVTMIPPALEAGLGELGKHGSIINRELGANMRLAYILTDIPLQADTADEFGADEFCLRCQVCTRECPAAAIGPDKQMVRGIEKWYVDFDKCVPYFNDTLGCGICLAVCPWSRPGVASGLVAKLARRKSRQEETRCS